mgnify:FL=1
MAKDKKSVLLYCDVIHTVEKLSDINAGLLFKHYLRYINDLNPEAPSELLDIVFEPSKQQLKRDLKEWEKTKEGYSKGGKASAEKRSKLKQVEPSLTKSTVTVNVTDTVTVTDSVSVNQITQWFKDLPNSVDLEDIARMTQSTKELLSPRVEEFKKYCEPSYPTYNKFLFHFKRWLLKNPPQQVKTRKALV